MIENIYHHTIAHFLQTFQMLSRLTYVRVSYVRGSDVRGLMFGVLMFGVQPRTSEYENPERPILNIENFGRSGFNPERPNLEVQRFRTFGVQPRTSEKGPPNVRTPNVRK